MMPPSAKPLFAQVETTEGNSTSNDIPHMPYEPNDDGLISQIESFLTSTTRNVWQVHLHTSDDELEGSQAFINQPFELQRCFARIILFRF